MPVWRCPAGRLMVEEGAAFCLTHGPDPSTLSQSGRLRPPGPSVGSVHVVLLPAWGYFYRHCVGLPCLGSWGHGQYVDSASGCKLSGPCPPGC